MSQPRSSSPRPALLRVAFLSIAAALLLLFLPAFPSPRTFPLRWTVSALWNNRFWQQASGYVLLGFCAASLLLSLRKRATFFSISTVPAWRFRHAALGLIASAMFMAHTGLTFGAHLSRLLSFNFIALIMAGALAIILRRERNGNAAAPVISWSLFTHLALFWSFLVLSLFHVFTIYYF